MWNSDNRVNSNSISSKLNKNSFNLINRFIRLYWNKFIFFLNLFSIV